MYHYHFPPSCLLAQLPPLEDGHSPQIGWSFDGFPIYGPLGPGGVEIRNCGATGADDERRAGGLARARAPVDAGAAQVLPGRVRRLQGQDRRRRRIQVPLLLHGQGRRPRQPAGRPEARRRGPLLPVHDQLLPRLHVRGDGLGRLRGVVRHDVQVRGRAARRRRRRSRRPVPRRRDVLRRPGRDGARLRRLDLLVVRPPASPLFFLPSREARLGRYKKESRDCEYVAKKSKRCKSKFVDDAGVSPLEACPTTCGSGCACADSTSWRVFFFSGRSPRHPFRDRYAKKPSRDCEYVAKKTKRCSKKDENKVKGYEACPVTCEQEGCG